MAFSDIDWEKLEKEVDEAIKKDCTIDFDSIELKKCMYMQKVAEDRLSGSGIYNNAIIFIAAAGVSFALTFIYLKDLTAIVGILTGIVLIAIAYNKVRIWGQQHCRCRKIILDAEKRILSEDSIESKQPQEPTDTSTHTQENTPSKGQIIGKIEFIKARLDLLKIIITAFFGFMFVVLFYVVQNTSFTVILYALFLIVTFGTFLTILGKIYDKEMNNLKDLS